ncbi:unnamed protein product [Owenia fusiformis]|uniref:EF-hand domain-containing protein n=1 Tax=Owenia fusiformis TaxID=6347 RepID=A0A8S4Q8A4_OWEFU|nr:unnamed protein product [Owenia fusiformis]
MHTHVFSCFSSYIFLCSFLGSGYISVDEFLHLYRRKLQADEDERELREAFRVLDKRNCGQINTEDLRWILKSLGDDLTPEEIEDMINDTDTDGSGTVDFEGTFESPELYSSFVVVHRPNKGAHFKNILVQSRHGG